jgi:hypothetical protein
MEERGVASRKRSSSWHRTPGGGGLGGRKEERKKGETWLVGECWRKASGRPGIVNLQANNL